MFIDSSSSVSSFAISGSLCLWSIGLRSASFASFMQMSAEPPMPIPMTVGGHGLLPALRTVFRANSLMPFRPALGVSIASWDMFSEPAPFVMTVISM